MGVYGNGNEGGAKAKRKHTSVSAARLSPGQSETRVRAEWQGYVNYTPNNFDKDKIKECQADGAKILEWWAQVCVDGYTVQQKDDSRNSCFVAEVYAGWADMPNAGYKITARASDPYSALVRVLYIHFYALAGEWGGTNHSAAFQDQWG